MFSLADIDQQIAVFFGTAESMYAKAEIADNDSDPVRALGFRCMADGFRSAASSLERMIENQMEREARDAIERGVA